MMAPTAAFPPLDLDRTLAAIWPATALFGFAECDEIPAEKGAYAILLRLPGRLTVALPGQLETVLQPGWYLYCGSARGPGGLKARIARHLQSEKKIRWHIDRLTTIAATRLALPFAGDLTECALADKAFATGGFSIPVPGFGSSDCRTCRSHLLRWEG